MSGPAEPKKYKNPVLNWIEFRLPIISYFEREYGDYPMPKNCNYFWSFGALATIILVANKSDLKLRISSSKKIIVNLKMIHRLPLDFLFFSSLIFEAYNQTQ